MRCKGCGGGKGVQGFSEDSLCFAAEASFVCESVPARQLIVWPQCTQLPSDCSRVGGLPRAAGLHRSIRAMAPRSQGQRACNRLCLPIRVASLHSVRLETPHPSGRNSDRNRRLPGVRARRWQLGRRRRHRSLPQLHTAATPPPACWIVIAPGCLQVCMRTRPATVRDTSLYITPPALPQAWGVLAMLADSSCA